MADRLRDDAPRVLLHLDEYYEDQLGRGGQRVATQLARQLSDPRPYDLDDVDLSRYRRLVPRWRSWSAVADACRDLGAAMLLDASEDP